MLKLYKNHQCFFMLSHIVKNVASLIEEFNEGDFVIIVRGTNDLGTKSVSSLIDVLKDFVSSITRPTVKVYTIQYRHDVHSINILAKINVIKGKMSLCDPNKCISKPIILGMVYI